jgi:hypothetical protein
MLPPHKIPECFCPTCKHPFDRATNGNGIAAAPNPGDVSVCVECGEYLEFNPDMTLRRLPDDEFAAMPYPVRYKLFYLRSLLRARRRMMSRN